MVTTRDPAREDGGARLAVRAIRGATSVAQDDPAEVRAATRELLEAIVERNGLRDEDLISALFTVTGDLTSEFPAHAAREMGWVDVPLLCALEIPVPGTLPRCVRVLLHVQSGRARSEVEHVYLGRAVALRPDIARGRDAAGAPDAPEGARAASRLDGAAR
jgi:chorismate mutase